MMVLDMRRQGEKSKDNSNFKHHDGDDVIVSRRGGEMRIMHQVIIYI